MPPVLNRDQQRNLLGGVIGIVLDRLLSRLPSLVDDLIDRIDGDDEKPSSPKPSLPDGANDEDAVVVTQPVPAKIRRVGRLELKKFWVARKNTPYSKGGGRKLLEGAEKENAGLSDPLQAGDRTCFDVSPYDTNGVKYEGSKPLILEYIVGGMGELQLQEENDYTPVVLVPWEGISPDTQGFISIKVKGTEPETGNVFETEEIKYRVHTWAA